ncbi:MAG: metallophosphoesterase family protein [Bacillus sp. (in: firmicutes)]
MGLKIGDFNDTMKRQHTVKKVPLVRQAFVLSDIHGHFPYFTEILKQWDGEMELVIIGDMIDRGPDSLKVVGKVMEMKEKYGELVTVLRGNHEDMFLDFLDNPAEKTRIYLKNGGGKTIDDFLCEEGNGDWSAEEVAAAILEKRSKEVEFLKGLEYYYEFGDVLFVHAGVDLAKPDWRDTEKRDFLWIRGAWDHPNKTGKILVYGHTPTPLVHKEERYDIWISEDRSFINIDGGAVFGGQLNAIIIGSDGKLIETFYVRK